MIADHEAVRRRIAQSPARAQQIRRMLRHSSSRVKIVPEKVGVRPIFHSNLLLRTFVEDTPNNTSIGARLVERLSELSQSGRLEEGLIRAAVMSVSPRLFDMPVEIGLSQEAPMIAGRQGSDNPPATWEEAREQVPGLMKFSDAKKAADNEGRTLTIIDHLRDEQRGYGRWTSNEPGLPRSALKTLGDKPAYYALYDWLKHSELPSDLHLPTKKATIDRLAEMADRPGDRPLHVHWALSSRQRRETRGL